MRACGFILLSCSLACDPAGGVLVRNRAHQDVMDGAVTQPTRDASGNTVDSQVDASESPDSGVSDAALPLDAADDAGMATDAGPRDPGKLVGNAKVGYYYAAKQADYAGGAVSLTNTSCNALVTVASGFADAVCIEGVGKLNDGRVLQFASLCNSQCGTAAYLCPTNVRACFYFEDASVAPWGRGSSGRGLLPLRSLAVDVDGPLVNKVLYVPALDGLSISASASSGAFIHDGCVRADDAGQLTGLLDFRLFTGDEPQYTALNAKLAGDSTTALYENAPHCQSLAP